MANMAFRGTPKQERELRKFIRKHKDQPGAMMPVLQEAQGIYGYLPREVQEIIAGVLGLKVKEDPTKVMPPVILYITSIITLFILTITKMGRAMGILGLIPPIVGIVTGLQINKWVKAGMPYNDQTNSFPS